jgi:hypothetical protein
MGSCGPRQSGVAAGEQEVFCRFLFLANEMVGDPPARQPRNNGIKGARHMRTAPIMIVSAAMLVLGACGEPSPDSSKDASTLPEKQNTEVDADPTPDTGTGGDQQTSKPAGTAAPQ